MLQGMESAEWGGEEGKDEGKGWRDSDGAIERLILSGCGKEDSRLAQQRANTL